MTGSATLTIVASSTTMPWPRHVAARGAHAGTARERTGRRGSTDPILVSVDARQPPSASAVRGHPVSPGLATPRALHVQRGQLEEVVERERRAGERQDE